jgi:hypothetical protein
VSFSSLEAYTGLWTKHKNPIRLASFLHLPFLIFLSLDLWATAKGQPCDSYFPDGRKNVLPVELSMFRIRRKGLFQGIGRAGNVGK